MARKDERQSGVDYRIRFFTHKGKEILLVDLSNCTPAYEEMVRHRCRGSRGCCSEGSPV
jgi:hypothetical protein